MKIKLRIIIVNFLVLFYFAGFFLNPAASQERFKSYFQDYYVDFRNEKNVRIVAKSADKIKIFMDIDDPAVKGFAIKIIDQLKNYGVNNLEIVKNIRDANYFILSAIDAKSYLIDRKDFFKNFYFTDQEFSDSIKSLERSKNSGAYVCKIKRKVTLNEDIGYVLFERSSSIPEKLKCINLGILLMYGFAKNEKSNIPSVLGGGGNFFQMTEFDKNALKFFSGVKFKGFVLYSDFLDNIK